MTDRKLLARQLRAQGSRFVIAAPYNRAMCGRYVSKEEAAIERAFNLTPGRRQSIWRPV